ncbi:MAG: glycosyltransferase [Calditrichota bacterium]
MSHLISAIIPFSENQPVSDTNLASLLNQLRFFDAEVILVNFSRKETSASLNERYSSADLPIREVESRVKGAPAAALNQGIKSADGEYLLLLHPAFTVHPESLELMIDYMQGDRSIGLMVPQMVTAGGAIIANCHRFPTHKDVLARALGIHELFPRSRFWNGWQMGDFSHQDIRQVEDAQADAWLISSAAWAQTGPFDENFLHDYYDTDWCHRLRDAGYIILFYPQAKVIATGHEEAEHLVRRRVSLFRLFDKYYDGVHHQILNLLVGLVIYLALPLQLLWRGLQNLFPRSRKDG